MMGQPNNKQDILTKKRERERLRYQQIKNTPELYAEYQRINKLKYENRKAQRKVVPISEMTPAQQRKQRDKWRKERKRRYLRMKDKKNKHVPDNTEVIVNPDEKNSNDNPKLNRNNQSKYKRNKTQIETVYIKEMTCYCQLGLQMEHQENTEDFVVKIEEDILDDRYTNNNSELILNNQSNCNRNNTQNTVRLKEMTPYQQVLQREKYENIEGCAVKTEMEVVDDLNTNNNAEVNLDNQRKDEICGILTNDIVYINEMTSCQQRTQNEKWREGKKGKYPEIKVKKLKSKLNKDKAKPDKGKHKPDKQKTKPDKGKDKPRPNNHKTKADRGKPTPDKHNTDKDKSKSNRHKTKPDNDKPKSANREKVLARKRERAKLRYQLIKNDPELYSQYQRKQNEKYEKMKSQKRILLINEMTSHQQKKQREQWRAERKRRDLRMKDKKAREKQLIAENSPPESKIFPVELVMRKTKHIEGELK